MYLNKPHDMENKILKILMINLLQKKYLSDKIKLLKRVTLFYWHKYMSFEKWKDTVEQDQKEFSDNFWDLEDKTNLLELTQGTKFDNNVSKEENLNKAFQNKVNQLIDSNLKNIRPEKREELKALSSQENGNMTPKEIMEKYQQIKELIGTRNASSYKSTNEQIAQNTQNNNQEKEESKIDFFSSLKKFINENSHEETIQKNKFEQERKERESSEKTDRNQQLSEAENIVFPDSIA